MERELLIWLSAGAILFLVLPVAWWAAHTRGWRRGYASGRIDALVEQQAMIFEHSLTSVNTLGGEYTPEERLKPDIPDHTSVLMATSWVDEDGNRHRKEEMSMVYYKDYPEYRNLPHITQTEETRQEYEAFWRQYEK